MKSENKQERAVALRLNDAALSKCVGGALAYATYASSVSSSSQTVVAPRVSAGSLIGSVSMPL